IDTTGAQVLTEIKNNLERAKKNLLIAVTANSRPAVRLQDFGITAALPGKIFPDVDRAIEWAEDDLLRKEMPASAPGEEIPLEKIGLLAAFAPAEVSALGRKFRRENYAQGKSFSAKAILATKCF